MYFVLPAERTRREYAFAVSAITDEEINGQFSIDLYYDCAAQLEYGILSWFEDGDRFGFASYEIEDADWPAVTAGFCAFFVAQGYEVGETTVGPF